MNRVPSSLLTSLRGPDPPRCFLQSRSPSSMALFLLMLVTTAALLAGCGASSSDSTPSAEHVELPHAATTATAATEGSPASGSTVSGAATVSPSQFTKFSSRLTFSVTLGTATTSTEGEEPGNLAVEAPVSGSASVTNTTSGYTMDENEVPTFSVFALYPESAAPQNCSKHAGTSEGDVEEVHDASGSKLCAYEIAGLASGCTSSQASEAGNEATVKELAPGATGALAVWPQVTSPTDVAPNPAATGVSLCGKSTSVTISQHLTYSRYPKEEAEAVASMLNKPPSYWIVVLDKVCAGVAVQPINSVVFSKPAGISGCYGTPRAGEG
jgi:hypothetical protein